MVDFRHTYLAKQEMQDNTLGSAWQVLQKYISFLNKYTKKLLQ